VSDAFERVAELFERARGLAPGERAALLDVECADDAALRDEVEALLAHEGAGADDALSDVRLDSVRRKLSDIASGAGAVIPDAAAPERIGEFTVVRRIGAGGMGVVYEALQERPRRAVAVKLLRPGLVTERARRRFEREAEILGRLRHPGIAQVFEVGECDLGGGPQPYLAMELVEGRPLVEHVTSSGLGVRARVELAAAICDAVHHAHTQGIVHRDLKPDNVLVEADGRPRVLDFGVAHAALGEDARGTLQTSDGEIVGTLDYMAPEQISGGDAARSPAVDVYALGAILHEMLTGETPHDLEGLSLVAAARRIAEGDPRPLLETAPGLPQDLGWIVDRALSPDPARRYASALALGDDLRRFLADEPVRARPASSLYKLERFVRRNRYVAAGIAVAFTGLAGGLVASIALFLEARAAQGEAEAAANKAEAVNSFLLERMLESFSPLELGRDVRVADVLDLAAPSIDDAFAGQPLTGAAVRHTLGRSYAELGLVEESHEQLVRAHADLLALLGPSHPDTLAAAADAGHATSARLGAKAALEITGPAFAAMERRGGARSTPEGLRLAQAHAEALFDAEQRDEGIALVNRTLALAEDALGLDDVTLSVRYQLARMRTTTGDLDGAEAELEAYLAGVRELHDRGDPREIKALLELAWTRYDRRGPDEDSLGLAREALERARDDLGPDHPETLRAVSTLASILTEAGDFDAALEANEQAYAAYARLLGTEHASTLRIHSNGAIILRRAERLDEALEVAQESLRRREAALGDDAGDVAQAYDVLGAIHLERGEMDEAAAALAESVARARAAFGPKSSQVADALFNLGTLHSRAEDYGAAEETYRELYETELEIHGARHRNTQQDRFQHARAIAMQGRHAEAVPILAEVLDVQRTIFDADDESLLLTQAWLGQELLRSGDAAAALPQLEEALAGLRAGEHFGTIEGADLEENLAEARRVAVGEGRDD